MRTHPFLDRYRGDGETMTRDLYDPRLFREEIFLPTLRELGEQLGARRRSHLVAAGPRRAARSHRSRSSSVSPAPASTAVYAELGDTGAAAALLGGIGALDEPGTVAIVGLRRRPRHRRRDHRQGRRWPARRPCPASLEGGQQVAYPDVLRARGQLVPSGETVQMGVPPASAQFVRGADEMLGLLGARCVDCGTINTPPSIHPHCTSCGSAKFVLEALARRGRVHTFVVNQTMPAPFIAPLPLVVIDLEDGARVMLQGVGDGAELAIGSEVELVLRRYAYERGVPVYGYKARPSRIGAHELEPGRSRRRRAHQVRRALRAELRADGGRRLRCRSRQRRRGLRADRRSRQPSSPRSAARSGARRASAATPSRRRSGLAGIPCTRIENACPSGSDAFRVGAMAVASGVHDVVLVIGVEKMRDKSAEEGLLARAAAGHPIFTRGETAPVLFAPFATRHMHEYGTTREMLASVAVKNHYNGARDPVRPLPERDHRRGRARVAAGVPTAPPPRLLPPDRRCRRGAARERRHRRALHRRTRCTSPASGSRRITRTFTRSRPSPRSRRRSSHRSARTRWPASSPSQIDCAEVHDCFTITEILDIEDLGFVDKGKGGVASLEGETSLTGRIPVNTSGGLLAKGHPIGATGVAQLVECWWQLRGEAGERQVETRNGYALQHNVGGRGSGVSVVNILTTNRA